MTGIAVIQFPGSNCERETCLALKRVGLEPQLFLWNEALTHLEHCAGYVIVGGFSYEDRSRAGIVATLEPIMQQLRHQARLGKPILGICNGAQILIESGLVPGLASGKTAMAVTHNRRVQNGKIMGTGYYNAWVTMKSSGKANAFNRTIEPNSLISAPVAHAEGRFIVPDDLLAILEQNGQIAFQYCTATGDIDAEFPANPNGSVANIAAVTNVSGNVMAMMPHPERTVAADAIFASMRDFIDSGDSVRVEFIDWRVPRYGIRPFELKQASVELVVESLLTDNHAVSVALGLQQQALPVQVKRNIHWEIEAEDSETVTQQILESGELFNRHKAVLLPQKIETTAQQIVLLTREKDNVVGQQKQQLLTEHWGIKGIKAIHYGVVWQLASEEEPIDHYFAGIIKTHILFNPYSYDCYRY